MAGADLAHFLQVTGGGDDHPGFALDRLHKETDRIGGDGRFQGGTVAKGDDLEIGRKGSKAIPRTFIRTETYDGDGAPVEVVLANNNFGLVFRHPFDLVTPFAHYLDGALHRLRSAVHGQDFMRTGKLAQLLIKKSQLIIAEGAGSQSQLLGLVDHGLQDLGVAVALVDGRIGRQAVEVFIALYVPDPHPLAPF